MPKRKRGHAGRRAWPRYAWPCHTKWLRIAHAELVVFVALALCLPASRVTAGPDWTESADAGDTIGTAESACGPGTLAQIGGALAGGGDFEGVYLIRIVDPVAFVARTDGVGAADFDTQLFLFDLQGFALLANDLSPELGGLGSLLMPPATDATGQTIPGPGFYYLAISAAGRNPASAGGLLFDQALADEISGPDGPGAAMPLSMWIGAGAAGNYDVALEGAEFPNGLGTPLITGQDIPTRYGPSALQATQTNRTGFANQAATVGGLTGGTELDALYVANDDDNLYIGVTGNLQKNADAWLIFIDTDNDSLTGQQELRTQGVAGPPFVLPNLGQPTDDCISFGTGTLLPIGAEYCIAVDTLGGKFSVHEYALSETQVGTYQCSGMPTPLFATRAFAGSSPINDNNAVLEQNPGLGYTGALNNGNQLGVSDVSGMGATSASSGLELSIPLARLGLMADGTVIRPYVIAADGGAMQLGAVHNQTLPPFTGTNCDGITPFGLQPDLSAAPMLATVTVSPGGSPPAGPRDGQDIPATFAPSAPLASQMCASSAGDQVFDAALAVTTPGSELDTTYVANDCATVFVGIPGNLAADGTRMVVVVDSMSGGERTLTGQTSLGGAVAGMEGDALPLEMGGAEVMYDFAFEINAAGGGLGPFFVDKYDLQANTRQYLGQANECLGDGTLIGGDNPGGVRVAYNGGNVDGVTGCPDFDPSCFNDSPAAVMAQATTATRGFELAIPLGELGLTDLSLAPDVRVWAFIAREDGFGSDQGLPAVRGNAQTEMQVVAGDGPTDFSLGDPMNPNQSYQTITLVQPVPPPCLPDVTDPVIVTCGTHQVVQGDGDPCQGVVPDLRSATDFCGAPLVMQQPHAPGSLLAPGTYGVTLTAVDGAGNDAMCGASFTITECPSTCATDDTSPTLSCPGSQVIVASGTCTGTVPNLLPSISAIDNCPGAIALSQAPLAGSQLAPGQHTITISAADANDNTTMCTVPLTVTFGPACSNDSCATAAPIGNGVTEFDTTGATTDGLLHGAGTACFIFGNAALENDIWFEYTPTVDGTKRISLDGSSFDTKMAVYTDCTTCPPMAAALLTCSDDQDTGCDFPGDPASLPSCTSEVAFNVTAGTCYKIRVGGSDATQFGPGQISIADNCDVVPSGTQEPVPPSGPCAFGMGDSLNGGCNVCAGGVAPFGAISCNSSVTGTLGTGFNSTTGANTRDLDWRMFTIGVESEVTWTVAAEEPVNTWLGTVLPGACPIVPPATTSCSFMTLAFASQLVPCQLTSVSVCLPAGTYATIIGPGPTIATAVGNLCPLQYNAALSCAAGSPPANDSCFSPIALAPNTTTTHDNFCATNEGVTPLTGCSNGPMGTIDVGADVFFTYMQPASGPVLVDLCGETDFDTVLEVAEACFGATIACDDDFCGGIGTGSASQLTFMASGGVTYIIRVAGFSLDPNSAEGHFTISVSSDVSEPVSIAASNPPHGHFDTLDTGSGPALTAGIGGAGTAPQGGVQYSTVSVTFNGPVSGGLQDSDIAVSCTGGGCPTASVTSGSGAGPYEIALSNVIPPLHCTTISFVGAKFTSGQQLQYRFSPGNVDLSSTSNTLDLLNLILALNNGAASANPARYNVNRLGAVNTQDLLRVIQLLNGVLTTQAFNQQNVASCP